MVKRELLNDIITWMVENGNPRVVDIEKDTIMLVNRHYPELQLDYNQTIFKQVKTLMKHWVNNNNGFRLAQQKNLLQNETLNLPALEEWVSKYVF